MKIMVRGEGLTPREVQIIEGIVGALALSLVVPATSADPTGTLGEKACADVTRSVRQFVEDHFPDLEVHFEMAPSAPG